MSDDNGGYGKIDAGEAVVVYNQNPQIYTPAGVVNLLGQSGGGGTLATVPALRLVTTASYRSTSVVLGGLAVVGDGAGGTYVYVATDRTSADNGNTIIVDASGRRWYRLAVGSSSYDPTAVAITGGSINGTTVGLTTPEAGAFTTVAAQTVTLSGQLDLGSWTTSGRPTTRPVGATGFNTTIGLQESWNGSAWVSGGSGGGGIPVIASITALRAATSTSLAAGDCYVSNYASSVVGGGGTFWYNAADTSSSDNAGTIIVDASTRRWYRVLDGLLLTPEMFGAVGDGSTDDTTALAGFLATLQSPVRPPGLLGARTYKVSNGFSITAPITLSGVNTQTSVISNSNASLNVPILRLSSAAVNGSVLEKFGVTSVTGTGTACYGIQVEGGQRFVLDELQVSYTYGGISIPAAQTGAWMTRCLVNNTTAAGYNIDAGNMNVTDNVAVNCGGNGFQFTSLTAASAGLIVKGCTGFNNGLGGAGNNFAFVGNATFGLIDLTVTSCTSSAAPFGCGFLFDTHGVAITVSDLFSELAGMTAAVAYSTPNEGILFTVNNGSVSLNNSTVDFSGASGIAMSCGNFTITGATLFANNQSGNANGAGLLIGASGAVTDFTVTGVNTKQSNIDAPPDSQAYGISSFSSGSFGLVTGCRLHGSTGPFLNVGNSVKFIGNLTDAATPVGQPGDSVTNSNAGVSMTSGAAQSVVSITLPPGQWDVSATVQAIPAGSTVITSVSAALNTVTNTMPSTLAASGGAYAGINTPANAGASYLLPTGTRQMTVSSNTTVYLVANTIFTTSTCTCSGVINARRAW
jgi:hypothetical protein